MEPAPHEKCHRATRSRQGGEWKVRRRDSTKCEKLCPAVLQREEGYRQLRRMSDGLIRGVYRRLWCYEKVWNRHTHSARGTADDTPKLLAATEPELRDQRATLALEDCIPGYHAITYFVHSRSWGENNEVCNSFIVLIMMISVDHRRLIFTNWDQPQATRVGEVSGDGFGARLTAWQEVWNSTHWAIFSSDALILKGML